MVTLKPRQCRSTFPRCIFFWFAYLDDGAGKEATAAYEVDAEQLDNNALDVGHVDLVNVPVDGFAQALPCETWMRRK